MPQNCRCYVEISRSRLAANYHAVSKAAGPGTTHARRNDGGGKGSHGKTRDSFGFHPFRGERAGDRDAGRQ